MTVGRSWIVRNPLPIAWCRTHSDVRDAHTETDSCSVGSFFLVETLVPDTRLQDVADAWDFYPLARDEMRHNNVTLAQLLDALTEEER